MSSTFVGRTAFIAFKNTPEIVVQSGDFESLTRVSDGTYDLTLSNPIDPAEAIYLASPQSFGGDFLLAEVDRAASTDTTVRVITRDVDGIPWDGNPSDGVELAILVKPLQ